MAKFNETTKGKKSATRTVSKDGVSAFKRKTAYTELCDRVLTCFFGEDRYYESGKQSSTELLGLIKTVAKEDPVFVAKLAVLAREKFNLRSVTQVIAAELAKTHKGDNLVSLVVERIVQRPDDLTELVAYLLKDVKTSVDKKSGRTSTVNKKLPNSIKKGGAVAITKFSEYHWSKYQGTGKSVKLVDLLHLFHPKPLNDEQSDVWRRAIRGELKVAETWERTISAAGQGKQSEDEKIEAKKDGWEKLILEKKLGYMAALRNIRNIIQAGVSKDAHEKLQAFLSNENAVLNSKQLPFRFYSAYKAICEGVGSMDPFIAKGYAKALSTALAYSAKNITQLKGRSVLACDCSGSMTSPLSNDSTITYHEVGAVLGALANQFCEESIVCAFGSSFKVVDMSDEASAVLANIDKVMKAQVGHSTDAHLVMQYLINNKIQADNILLFTDCQLNGSYGWGGNSLQRDIDTYRKTIKNDVRIYELNLAGYGSSQVNQNDPNYVHMAGWSDNTLKYITDYQELKYGIIDMVNAVEL